MKLGPNVPPEEMGTTESLLVDQYISGVQAVEAILAKVLEECEKADTSLGPSPIRGNEIHATKIG